MSTDFSPFDLADWFNPATGLEVLLLGMVDYDDAYALQVHLADQIRQSDEPRAYLVIVEHPPLITFGRHASRADIRADDLRLQWSRMETQWANRGGPTVQHGPGQLAIYPVLPLELINHDIPRYLDRLDQVIVNVCEQMKVKAAPRPAQRGVWTEGGWLSKVGVTVNDGVVYHGTWLNVHNDLIAMRLLESQHSKETRAATLLRQSPCRVEMHKVREAVIQHFETEFEFQRQYLYTSHPLVDRKAPQHVFVGCTE